MSEETGRRYKLIEEIIRLSEADNWHQAKSEWELAEVHQEEEPETCLCGQYPILEICTLENTKNGNLAVVGNVCVKKFLGLESDLIFNGLKRVGKDQSKGLNVAAATHAYRKGWINKWEFEFLTSTARKRKLTDKQALKRSELNQKILQKTKNSLQRGKL